MKGKIEKQIEELLEIKGPDFPTEHYPGRKAPEDIVREKAKQRLSDAEIELMGKDNVLL